MTNLKVFYHRMVRRHKWLESKNLFVWFVRIAAFGLVGITMLFIYYSLSLPNPNKLLDRQVAQSTKILAKDGTVLYEVHGEFNRTQVNLDQISPDLINATVAVEDKNFYNHKGISITGIIRSIIVDVFTGSKQQGGSTITQQFVKNAVLTKEKFFSRKLKEIILSIEIEARYSKDDILKLYLNEIPYGRNAYGIESASRTYFGKSAKELNLAESAYLAALPQAPTYFNPLGPHLDALEARKNSILTLMREQDYITEDQEKEAKETKVTFREIRSQIIAPHFVFYIQAYLAEKYGEKTLEEGGLKVYTTLDPKLQTIAETAVSESLASYGKRYNANNAALVAIDPKNGQILAMVGSKDYFADPQPEGCTPGKNCTFEPSVNVALSQRQPGSSFKPYVYVTAFGRDYNYAPASMLMDVVTNFGGDGSGGDYIPRNFSNQQFGPLSMRQTLAGSLNIPAVKTLALVGVENATKTAHDLGITSPLKNCGLSLVLGGCEVRLLDHVSSYGTLANQGKRNDKTGVLKIEDAKGNVLEEWEQDEKEVLDPQAVYQLTSIMTDNAARAYIFGSNSPLTLPGRAVAAKTGTTNNFKDGWTLGFTPSLVAGVWSGNNNGDPLKTDAVNVAGPIWNKFMREALKDTPAESFVEPEGIQHVAVDALSGKLPGPFTVQTKNEVFANYNVPTETDKTHVAVKINSETGAPADDNTPPDKIITKFYTILHSERPNSPNWEDPVVAWAKANGYDYPPTGAEPIETGGNNQPDTGLDRPTLNITSPKNNSNVTGTSFQLTATAIASSGISKVELGLDGDILATLNSPPFSITVNRKLTTGKHTVTARATSGKGGVSETSADFFVTGVQSLSIIEPSNNSVVSSFPIIITAQSPNQFDSVSFYAQSGLKTTLIGTGEPLINGDSFQYTIAWDKPKVGTYKIYAKSSNNISSNKITIIVP